jgi:hypothetical protein
MTDYWFCCWSTSRLHICYQANSTGDCGDGPHYRTLVSTCIKCGHGECGSCISCSENDSWMTPSSTGIQHTTSLHDRSHGHGHIRIGSRLTGAPVDGGEKEFRWTCCGCGGDNSCTYDVGCSNCSNHWRQGCCYVYEVARPKR